MRELLTTPILLITFNRPNHTKQVWEEIKKQKPTQVFVFQDGARDNQDNEKINVVRAIFDEKLEWDCELKTFLSDKNLGCGLGPATGISWFFANVDKGIIMEDDCLPHPDFFKFCADMLEKYKNYSKIMAIGTTTYHDDYPCHNSYCFSKYFTGGAWASWSRSWKGFDFNLNELNIIEFKKKLSNQFFSTTERKWWLNKAIWIKQDKNQKSYWDYQMQIHILNRDGIVIRPQKNMISNIGFDAEGTHTIDNGDNRGYRKVYSCYPLVYPNEIAINTKIDYLYMAKEHKKKIDKRIVSYIYNTMNNNHGFFKTLLNKYKQIKETWKNR